MIWDWTTNKPIIIVPACGQKVWGGRGGGGRVVWVRIDMKNLMSELRTVDAA